MRVQYTDNCLGNCLIDPERDEEIRKLSEQVAVLASENSKLESLVRSMDKKMSKLFASFEDIAGSFERNLSPAVIIVEEMDKPTAKQKVFDFMKEHRTSDIEKLHENIRCDIGLLIEIVDELCAEGAIAGGD